MKLLKLFSQVDDFLGRDGVQLSWFIPERKDRLSLDYEQLIEGFDQEYYNRLNADHESGIGILDKEIGFLQYSNCALDFINEHFTLSESEQLKAYLQTTYGLDCTEEEIRAPVTLQVIASAELTTGEGYGFFKLPAEDKAGYNLNFPVWGYYDVRSNPPAKPDGYSATAELGAIFLATALQKLGYPIPESFQLLQLVTQITVETGLVAEQKFAPAPPPQPETSGDFLDDIVSRYTIVYEDLEEEDE